MTRYVITLQIYKAFDIIISLNLAPQKSSKDTFLNSARVKKSPYISACRLCSIITLQHPLKVCLLARQIIPSVQLGNCKPETSPDIWRMELAILSNQLVFQIYKPDNTSITVSTREESYSQYFTQAQDHLLLDVK